MLAQQRRLGTADRTALVPSWPSRTAPEPQPAVLRDCAEVWGSAVHLGVLSASVSSPLPWWPVARRRRDHQPPPYCPLTHRYL